MKEWGEGIPTIFTTGLFIGLLLLLFFISLLQDLEALTLLALFLLLFIYGNRSWSLLSRYRLEVSCTVDKERVFPESPLLLKASLKNRKRLPILVGLKIMGGEDLTAAHETIIKEGILPGNTDLHWEWTFFPPKRGCYSVTVDLYSGDLPGLYFRWLKEQSKTLEFMVYPRIHCLKEIAIIPRQAGHRPIERLVKDPINLVGTREYLPDRPARFINWMATARHNLLQENIFSSAGSLQVLLVVDVSFHQDEETFEILLEGVASLAVEWERKGVMLGFLTNSSLNGAAAYIPPGQGPYQLEMILSTLACMQQRPREEMEKILSLNDLPPDTLYVLFLSQERTGEMEAFFQDRGCTMMLLTPSLIRERIILEKGDPSLVM